MKISLFTLSLALAGGALAQSPVATAPVGSIEIQISPATSPASPSLTAISLPFHGQITHVGTVASLDGTNRVSVTTGLWTSGQHISSPKFFRLRTGISAGRVFPITGNTPNQVTLNTGSRLLVPTAPATSNEIQINAGDKFEIVAANTLGTVFGTNVVPLMTGASADLADNVLLFDGANWSVYFHNGTVWQNENVAGNQNNVVISRDTALFVRRRGLTPATLFLSGVAPSRSETLDLPATSSRFTGHRLPLSTTLGGLGFHNTPGWRSGPSAATSDTVQMWSGSTWQVFYYNGTQWRKTGSLLNYNTQPVPAGSGMFVIRQGDSGSDVTISLTAPYSF